MTISPSPDINIVLLHDQMHDKQGALVCTSLTMIDVHDIARSACTYGLRSLFIAHPSPTLRKLAFALRSHWQEGFGATYNVNRKEALEAVQIVSSLDEAVAALDLRNGRLPKLIATSAHPGENRISFSNMQEKIKENKDSYLIMLGTGWGMSQQLLNRADYFLEPINGPTPYNHLSVRSAAAIIMDRLLGV